MEKRCGFLTFLTLLVYSRGFVAPLQSLQLPRARIDTLLHSAEPATSTASTPEEDKKKVVIIGAGWGGLSAAHNLHKADPNLSITVVDSSPRVGGLVRDGYKSMNGKYKAEAGQHGFWDGYYNIFQLLDDLDLDDALTGYAEQGQYSPRGLEAIWPVYRNNPALPTGLAQALYTKFTKLSVLDRVSAAPLVLAFSEFDNSPESWEKYDDISFRDLCVKLGVSRKCYEEAFEPMILTGLFAPGSECSAAAALGMAYFFVLKNQNAFDVRWCKGNIGERIFQPWVQAMEGGDINADVGDGTGIGTSGGVQFLTSTRVIDFVGDQDANVNDMSSTISKVVCQDGDGKRIDLDADTVVFAVGGAALNAMVRNSPLLAKHAEFRKFANLRGTGVLATRLYFDKQLDIPYSANACWGFDKGIGQTFFDITKLHGIDDAEGSIVEVDYYHAASLNVMDDKSIVRKVKRDLETILGKQCKDAQVMDATIVRLPSAVNWYCPGSYRNMPDVKSEAIDNVYFVGDLVKTEHGSWSQEKAYVTGVEASNLILGKPIDTNIIPLSADEPHVAAGRKFVALAKTVARAGDVAKAPSLVDFLW
jgi:uncharacterized protein with NAD-binding domain and iron-sulfur cluster